MIVDANGMPQNPRVIRSIDPELDLQALLAVQQYRFRPAMKRDQPVPVMIAVEVSYRLY